MKICTRCVCVAVCLRRVPTDTEWSAAAAAADDRRRCVDRGLSALANDRRNTFYFSIRCRSRTRSNRPPHHSHTHSVVSPQSRRTTVESMRYHCCCCHRRRCSYSCSARPWDAIPPTVMTEWKSRSLPSNFEILSLSNAPVGPSCLRSSSKKTHISRNVSFPDDESKIVTGVLETLHPWESSNWLK